MSFKSWEEAFFHQAEQDFKLACFGLTSPTKHSATIIMLLQMFFEKYAKAVYCRSTHALPQRNHKTAEILCSALQKSPKYGKYKKKNNIVSNNPQKQFIDFFDFLRKIESLQPSNANKKSNVSIGDTFPQLEYPWKTSEDEFCSPCTDLDLIHEVEDINSRVYSKILPIAQNLINDFPIFMSTGCFPAK